MAADNREFVNKFANEGGGDIYAEDKRFEELKSATAKTGSQISTLAQYIPLQDTDGNLVKINPQSFQEAVRNVLGSLLANNDKGTTISGIPALSGSGASLDFGSVSPANLASVLGVPEIFSGALTQNYSINCPTAYGTLVRFKGNGNYNLYLVAEMDASTGQVGDEIWWTLHIYPLDSNVVWKKFTLQ